MTRDKILRGLEVSSLGLLVVAGVATFILNYLPNDNDALGLTRTELIMTAGITIFSFAMLVAHFKNAAVREVVLRSYSTLMNLNINFGGRTWLLERRLLPDLRTYLYKNGKAPTELVAYGKTLRGLLAANEGLFIDLINEGTNLRFVLLDQKHADLLNRAFRWSDTANPKHCLIESMAILDRLKEIAVEKGRPGAVEYKCLDQIPDGGIVGVDIGTKGGSISFQVELPGCAVDRLPIIYIEHGSDIFNTMCKAWVVMWAGEHKVGKGGGGSVA